MGDLDRGGVAGRDAVHGDGPVGGGGGEDVGLAGTGGDGVDRACPQALIAGPHRCEDGRAGRRAGGPRPDPDTLVRGAADQDSGGGEEADGVDAVGMALERGMDATEGGVLRGRAVRERPEGGGNGVVRTSGFHRATQRPAPNARRPHGDQSAVAGWRFAPTAMSGQDTAAMGSVNVGGIGDVGRGAAQRGAAAPPHGRYSHTATLTTATAPPQRPFCPGLLSAN